MKKRNPRPPQRYGGVHVALTGPMAALLRELTLTGYFGTTTYEVAERLLAEKLRELALQGWTKR